MVASIPEDRPLSPSPSAAIAAMSTRDRIVAIVGSSSGNLVEWYDFYTYAFTSNLQLAFVESAPSKKMAYALFIFAGLIVFNFFSEMAYRSPMLLHEYAHFIKQTIFPSDMLAVISTLRAAAYTAIGAVALCE